MTRDRIQPFWMTFWGQAWPLRNECSVDELERLVKAARNWLANLEQVLDAKKAGHADSRREPRRVAA
jgi:hypothetical protein